jgi:hypothetical protein
LVIAAPAVVKAESIMGIVIQKGHVSNFEYEYEKHLLRTKKAFQFFRGDGMWVDATSINSKNVQDVLSKYHLNDERFLRGPRTQWIQESGGSIIYSTGLA